MQFFRKLKYSLILSTFLTHPSFATNILNPHDDTELSPLAISRPLKVSATDIGIFNIKYGMRYRGSIPKFIPEDQLPPFIDFSAIVKIVDQGTYPTSTVNATAQAFYVKQILEALKNQPDLTLEQAKNAIPFGSRFYLYNLARLELGAWGKDVEANLGTLASVLHKNGIPPESAFPYTEENFKTNPLKLTSLHTEAKKNLATGNIINELLYNESDMVTKIKQAMASNIPVVLAFKTPQDFLTQKVSKSGELTMPASGTPSVGGLSAFCAKYDDSTQLFTLANSWSTNWGKDGYLTIPYEFVNDPEWFIEALLISSITKPNTISLPKPVITPASVAALTTPDTTSALVPTSTVNYASSSYAPTLLATNATSAPVATPTAIEKAAASESTPVATEVASAPVSIPTASDELITASAPTLPATDAISKPEPTPTATEVVPPVVTPTVTEVSPTPVAIPSATDEVTTVSVPTSSAADTTSVPEVTPTATDVAPTPVAIPSAVDEVTTAPAPTSPATDAISTPEPTPTATEVAPPVVTPTVTEVSPAPVAIPSATDEVTSASAPTSSAADTTSAPVVTPTVTEVSPAPVAIPSATDEVTSASAPTSPAADTTSAPVVTPTATDVAPAPVAIPSAVDEVTSASVPTSPAADTTSVPEVTPTATDVAPTPVAIPSAVDEVTSASVPTSPAADTTSAPVVTPTATEPVLAPESTPVTTEVAPVPIPTATDKVTTTPVIILPDANSFLADITSAVVEKIEPEAVSKSSPAINPAAFDLGNILKDLSKAVNKFNSSITTLAYSLSPEDHLGGSLKAEQPITETISSPYNAETKIGDLLNAMKTEIQTISVSGKDPEGIDKLLASFKSFSEALSAIHN